MKDLIVNAKDATHCVTLFNKESDIPLKFRTWSTYTIAKSKDQARTRAKYQYAFHYLCWKLRRTLKETVHDKDLILTQLANFKRKRAVTTTIDEI
jgi:hypothetical protein